MLLDGPVGQKTGGDEMGNRRAVTPRGLPRFRQVQFQKRAVLARHVNERVHGLDDARAGGPAAADAGGQRKHGNAPALQRGLARGAAGTLRFIPQHIPVPHVLYVGIGGQPVPGQADTAEPQVVAQLLVLDGIEAVCRHDGGGRPVPGRPIALRRGVGDPEQVGDQRAQQVVPFLRRAGARRGQVQFDTPEPGRLGGIAARQFRHVQHIIGGRHERLPAGAQGGPRARFIDGEIVHHRVHGKRQRVLQLPFRIAHDGQNIVAKRVAPRGVHHHAHAAAGHAAQHEKAVEVIAQPLRGAVHNRFREPVGHPGNDGLERVVPVARGASAQGFDIARLQRVEDAVENTAHAPARVPFGLGPEQVFLRDHFQDGPDVLRHAAVNQHEGGGQALRNLGMQVAVAEDAVPRQEPPLADAGLGITVARRGALNHLDAGPDAARILPAAAGTAQPFAENGAGRGQPPLPFGQPPFQRFGLARGAHERADDAGEQVGGYGKPGPLGNVVDPGDQFEAHAGTDDAGEYVRKGMLRAFERRGNKARRDDARLEQA